MADALKTTPRYWRVLRLTWTVGCVVVAVALCVLWVRSYSWTEIVRLPIGPNRRIKIGYNPGLLGGSTFSTSGPASIALTRMPTAAWERRLAKAYPGQNPSQLTGGTLTQGTTTIVLIPFWFATLGASLIGLAPWMRPIRQGRWIPRRFSLRTLLLTMTAVAVLLGVVVLAVS